MSRTRSTSEDEVEDACINYLLLSVQSDWTRQYKAVYTQGVWRPLPLRRFVVQDTSMQPTLLPGDRVIVFQWSRTFKVGDTVVFVDPERRRTIAIKRVARADDQAIDVRGDNVNVSRDSREFGPVPRALILGRAIYRYLPGSRRGRL